MHNKTTSTLPRGIAAPRSSMQTGVVLIIALLMLVIISIVAALNIRNATSSEAISGNIRTSQLAMQAAEVALRYCETSVGQLYYTGTATFTTTFVAANILPYSSTPKWQSTTLWDSTTTDVFVLPASTVNASGISTTYARMPECMVTNQPVANSAGTLSTTRSYVVTARGFGPEVVNDRTVRPQGSEVWLQSTIELP
jgi:type IV pilus assembly protein PilX